MFCQLARDGETQVCSQGLDSGGLGHPIELPICLCSVTRFMGTMLLWRWGSDRAVQLLGGTQPRLSVSFREKALALTGNQGIEQAMDWWVGDPPPPRSVCISILVTLPSPC